MRHSDNKLRDTRFKTNMTYKVVLPRLALMNHCHWNNKGTCDLITWIILFFLSERDTINLSLYTIVRFIPFTISM